MVKHTSRCGYVIFTQLIPAVLALAVLLPVQSCDTLNGETEEYGETVRERVSINHDWKFYKYKSADEADNLIYDVRPDVDAHVDDVDADTEPEDAERVEADRQVLKPWILPSGNAFINDPARRHERPESDNTWDGSDFPFVQTDFNDSDWETVHLPHDWAAEGPFLVGPDAAVTGGMGRLPSPGVAWYRKKLDIPESDTGKSVFLDVDGAMSYAIVWLNGHLVGGWPFGYSSWRLDLTPYINHGGENQLAIRLDNPPYSSRWYPGGGIYRNVWLTKTNPVHIAHWGTYITTPEVSARSARVDLELTLDNDSNEEAAVRAVTRVYNLDENGNRTERAVVSFDPVEVTIAAESSATISGSVTIRNPRLWGPYPQQTPNRHVAVTTLYRDGNPVDVYTTNFGIRSLEFDPERGVIVNGEHIYLRGVNQHHDLGPLGGAFNTRAAERQIEILREMGANAIRMAHNPPAPELLDLTDRMGVLVVNESFDVWERRKTPLDFHLIFPDWYEQDLRALVRRDRNHPSVIMWSTGNEVGEQYTGEAGAEWSRKLTAMVHEEDPTRPVTVSMNFAKPPMEFPGTMDVISLNYQGEGIRYAPEYAHLQGITTHPLYNSFREAYPDKVIFSSENAAALSSRGTYLFPVVDAESAPVSDGVGGDSENYYVCSYELYTAPFGSSADRVFRSLEQHPFVAGGFVWSGWDYIGEPTPYYDARSSYFGVIDLAGFRKDRFYLYQSQWRPEHPMVHILPHWNWPDRIGEVTPVHVFTSGDEVELFLNGESLGRKRKGEYEYRLRWDDVMYEPGELRAVAYNNGARWSEAVVKTTDIPAKLYAEADRYEIKADGYDLSFLTVEVRDRNDLFVANAHNHIRFSVDGPGEIVATENGDPTNFTPFPSHERNAFNGLVLVIIRGIPDESGVITVSAASEGLESATVTINAR
jgi:beta-galactosidase